MPVGSCLGGQIDNNEEANNGMEVIMTSSLLNQADQFAFMQQTLLMQIFRIHPSNGSGLSNETGSVSSRDSNSSLCPTCIAFSDHCCQRDNGSLLFHEFIEANLHYCLWDQKLADALQSLRYQGYVCPGIMVMIANSTHLELMADLWRRQLLTTPRGTRISQVGLSSGCVVRPVPLAHSISLHDVLCLILARLKQRGQVADMNTILDSVQQDWSSLVHRLKVDGSSNEGGNHSGGEDLRDKVHSALGALIKQRKVYYTGNKGYFLVGPDSNSNANNQGCSSIFSNATSPQAKLTYSIGSKFSQFRHSLRNNGAQGSSPKNPDTYNDNDSPDSSLLSNGKREGQNSPLATSTEAKSPESSNGEESSPNNSFLERSQSLRISKKSLRSLSSRAGGSLRLSKKEALALKQVKEEEDNEQTANPDNQPATPKQSFERKNSFLSKLFSNGSPGSNPKKKPSAAVLATFSAQFPPPEIIQYEQAPQQIYQQLIPRAARPPFSNENTSPPPKIYEGPPTYGYAMVQHRRPAENGLYSAPPPPLPYRPPPPNPYLQVDNASDQYARILPKNPQQQLTTMNAAARGPPPPMPVTPPLPLIPASVLSASQSSSPACSESETYARVSNLKKVNSSAMNNSGSSPQRNVRFADEQLSSSSGVTSTSSTSSSSGPSSIESQKNNVYDETLVVIEKSNKELEQKLTSRNHRMVDTIHNNKNSLVQEVIYEVEVPMVENQAVQPKPQSKEETSIAPSYPSISDLTLTDISCFKSLTAQKMMAGLSFNSIDTLLEVNAAAEARSKLNESTETVDFGII